jgi:hypothetical protein
LLHLFKDTRLREGLEADSGSDALSLLRTSADAGSAFKSRLSLRIASRCAEMIAAEIERDKQSQFTILMRKTQKYSSRDAKRIAECAPRRRATFSRHCRADILLLAPPCLPT